MSNDAIRRGNNLIEKLQTESTATFTAVCHVIKDLISELEASEGTDGTDTRATPSADGMQIPRYEITWSLGGNEILLDPYGGWCRQEDVSGLQAKDAAIRELVRTGNNLRLQYALMTSPTDSISLNTKRDWDEALAKIEPLLEGK